MNFTKLIKMCLLVASCSLFMGNRGCESDEAIRRGRILKKSVFSRGITSSKIEVGDNIEIDVEGIINGKYLTELQNSQYFVSTNRSRGVQSLSDEADLLARRNLMSFGTLAINESGKCTKDLPEVVLEGQATEFELGNEFGIGIGFGPGGIGNVFEGLEFNLKKMSMGLNINAFQPKTGTPLASAHKRGVKTDFGGGIRLNLGIISINPTAMLRQPVAEVISDTLRGALINVGSRMEEEGQEWSARVYQDNDSHIMINAGFRHGLKKGDTLYISNMQYEWSGQPCDSDLLYQINRQDRDNPIAKVIIETEPSADMTIARVFEQRGVDIQEGARAYIYYLAGSQDENDPLPDAPNPAEVFR